jgi:hypothetical protein
VPFVVEFINHKGTRDTKRAQWKKYNNWHGAVYLTIFDVNSMTAFCSEKFISEKHGNSFYGSPM